MSKTPSVAQIIPFAKLPRSLDYFDYLIPENLRGTIEPGLVVSVPFKHRSILGIVDTLKSTSRFKNLKEIYGMHTTVPLLNKKQLQIVKKFANYYHYSVASALKLFAPDIPKKFHSFVLSTHTVGTRHSPISEEIKRQASSFFKDANDGLILNYNDAAMIQWYQAVCEYIIATDKQILILVPHKQRLDWVLAAFPSAFYQELAVVTGQSSIKKNQWYSLWREIQQKKKHIIIGTRSALFSLPPALDTIILDQSHSDDLKNWDQKPRYHAAKVAEMYQQEYACRIVYSSVAPRIADFFSLKESGARIMQLGSSVLPEPIKVVDLNNERQIHFTYLSQPIISQIHTSLNKKEKCLLIVNKKGYASAQRCKECGFIPTCPTCMFPYTVTKGRLYCFHCLHEYEALTTCPKCSSQSFFDLGIGIEQMFELVQVAFPAVRVTVDLDVDADIYISTAYFPYSDTLKKVGFLAFLYIDSLMYLPDFSTNERIYQLIAETTQRLSAITDKKVKTMIQTAFPDNVALQYLMHPFTRFYKQETTARKQFGYPPYKQLIKFFVQNKEQSVAEKSARQLSNLLQVKYGTDAVTISPPYPYFRTVVRGRYRFQILLKLDKNNTKLLQKILADVPRGWQIDKDPTTVL